MRILMVCLGNICRSPLAEGILRHKITEHNLDCEVDSAGTGSWHVGNRPDSRSIEVAQKYNIDITTQRARQLKKTDFKDFDRIFVMDSSNYQNVMQLASNPLQKAKVELIMNLVKPNYNQAVPDPYRNDDGFEQVYQMINAACDILVEKLRNLKKNSLS